MADGTAESFAKLPIAAPLALRFTIWNAERLVFDGLDTEDRQVTIPRFT